MKRILFIIISGLILAGCDNSIKIESANSIEEIGNVSSVFISYSPDLGWRISGDIESKCGDVEIATSRTRSFEDSLKAFKDKVDCLCK